MCVFLLPCVGMYIPVCCEKACHAHDFQAKIKRAIETIQRAQIGQELLKRISRSSYPITISTHPLTESCDSSSEPVRTRVLHAETEAGPSSIYVKPDVEEMLTRHFTLHHQKWCVKRGLVSKLCWREDGPCTRSLSFVRILFHELVHAYHNQKGINQRHNTQVPAIFGNMEEMKTIEIENRFAVELSALEESPNDPLQTQRYGWHLPDGKEQKKAFESALSERAHNFLLVVAPSIISTVGQIYSASSAESFYASSSRARSEEEQMEIDRLLYGSDAIL